jgi:Na+-transporting NADH:ubiquinone oxidoreductase subunit NqrF
MFQSSASSDCRGACGSFSSIFSCHRLVDMANQTCLPSEHTHCNRRMKREKMRPASNMNLRMASSPTIQENFHGEQQMRHHEEWELELVDVTESGKASYSEPS